MAKPRELKGNRNQNNNKNLECCLENEGLIEAQKGRFMIFDDFHVIENIKEKEKSRVNPIVQYISSLGNSLSGFYIAINPKNENEGYIISSKTAKVLQENIVGFGNEEKLEDYNYLESICGVYDKRLASQIHNTPNNLKIKTIYFKK